MAEVVQITGTSYEGKKRNIFAPIGLSIITLGIYGLVWYYKTNKELAEIGRAHGTEELGTSPGVSLLAVTFGALIIVPPFVSYFKFFKRQQAAAELLGTPETGFNAVGGMFLMLIYFIGSIVFQNGQNTILEKQAQLPAGQAGATIPPPPA
jgi:hypothetical protein